MLNVRSSEVVNGGIPVGDAVADELLDAGTHCLDAVHRFPLSIAELVRDSGVAVTLLDVVGGAVTLGCFSERVNADQCSTGGVSIGVDAIETLNV